MIILSLYGTETWDTIPDQPTFHTAQNLIKYKDNGNHVLFSIGTSLQCVKGCTSDSAPGFSMTSSLHVVCVKNSSPCGV